MLQGIPTATRTFSGHHGAMTVDYSLMEGYEVKSDEIKLIYHTFETTDKDGIQRHNIIQLVSSFV